MDDEIPGWDGYRRSDRMQVAKNVEGIWIIRPPDGRLFISHCPCCGATFKTAKTAKLVADAIYPLNPPPAP